MVRKYNKKSGFYYLYYLSLVFVAAISLYCLLELFWFAKQENIAKSILDGKRIELVISTGQIYGKKQDLGGDLIEDKTDLSNEKSNETKEVESREAEVKLDYKNNSFPKTNLSKSNLPQTTLPEDNSNLGESQESKVQQDSKFQIDSNNKIDGNNIIVKSVANKNLYDYPQISKKDIGGDIKADMVQNSTHPIIDSAPLVSVDKKANFYKASIIIIVRDLGLSNSSTEQAFALPEQVNFSFSPYSATLEEWVKKAKQNNHEVILEIPLESKDYNYNEFGLYALDSKFGDAENIKRLKILKSSMPEFDIMMTPFGEVFTTQESNIKLLINGLQSQNINLVYGNGDENHLFFDLANKQNYKVASADILLDKEISVAAINENIKLAESIAKKKGYVIVIAEPYPLTIKILTEWIKYLKDNNFVLAKISENFLRK